MPSPPPPPAPPDPTPETLAVVAGLDAGERGFVLGRLAMPVAQPGGVAGHLAGPSGQRCAAALTRIAALARTERLRLVEWLAREALAPLPAGCANVHPDTLRDLLAGESDATVRLLAGASDELPDVLREVAAARLASADDAEPSGPLAEDEQASAAARAELMRSLLAPILAVPELPATERAERPGLALAALSPAALLRELAAAGAELLGTSLRGADAATLQRACVGLGEPWAGRVRTEAARDRRATSAGGLSVQQARALIAGNAPADTPLGTLHRVGATALGVVLGARDPGGVPAVVQRLPADLALLLSSAAEEDPD